MDRPRLLLVGKGPPDTGGISAVLTETMAQIEPHMDVDLLNLTRSGDAPAGALSVHNLRRTLEDFLRLLGMSGRFDIVDIHSAFVPSVTILRAGLLALAAKSRRSKVILHIHGGGLPEWATSPLKRLLMAAALIPVDEVVVVSHHLERAVRRVRPVSLIPNGVDTDTFRPAVDRSAAGAPVILFAGLLADRKGVMDLIEAGEILTRRGVDHHLLLVGGTPDEGTAAEAKVRAAASGRETFAGPQPRAGMPDIYREADIFCLPSWFEAMPLSILEAMASGLPIVATSVGQIPEMVSDDTGLLVPPRRPGLLADALESLLVDPYRRRVMGMRARHLALERFSVGSSTQHLMRVLERLG